MRLWREKAKAKARRTQPGLDGEWFITLAYSTWPIAAQPSGAPGWPLLAAWTMSMERPRMVLIASLSLIGG